MTNPGCAPSKTWGALELPAQQELRDLPGRLDLRVLLGHPDLRGLGEDRPDPLVILEVRAVPESLDSLG